jgi:hypothetical protein
MVAKRGRARDRDPLEGSALGALQALLPVVAVDDAVAFAAPPFAGGGFLGVEAAASRKLERGEQRER